ncbi:hypothetical protein V8G54_004781 [Vigna mungo]|uniref:Uncharacterized protein n=1 Tax=Vigna mungo TaxID=3915 RepID=A0AAQ3SDA9_VIGMU
MQTSRKHEIKVPHRCEKPISQEERVSKEKEIKREEMRPAFGGREGYRRWSWEGEERNPPAEAPEKGFGEENETRAEEDRHLLDEAIEILENIVIMRKEKLGTANPDVADENHVNNT